MTRVLLVDDSPAMRHFVERTLRMTGLDITVYSAGNGRSAMETAHEVRPHVIITDLNMPEMSGQELVVMVHASAELRSTKVIVLSADRSPERHEELVRSGADDYLTKPVSPEILRNSLTRLLEVDQ